MPYQMLADSYISRTHLLTGTTEAYLWEPGLVHSCPKMLSISSFMQKPDDFKQELGHLETETYIMLVLMRDQIHRLDW
jgi:hypothetical protein